MLLEFQKALAEEIKKITANMLFMNEKGETTALNVFEQVLPLKRAVVGSTGDTQETESDEDALPFDEGIMSPEETEPFPYCVVRVNDGEQQDPYSPHYVYVEIIIGIYEKEREKAYQGVVNIIQAFMERFYKNSTLDGRYRMKGKDEKSNVQWTIEEGETISYFFGGIAMTWQLPAYRLEDDLS